jgi:DNA-directed RNA polymerase specialized sigma24 family protein
MITPNGCRIARIAFGLRQKLLLGRSHRQVADSLGVAIGTVGTTVLRARAD